MPVSDTPTNPVGTELDIDIHKTERMPEIPEGCRLIVRVRMLYGGAYLQEFRRDIVRQNQYDAYRILVKHPEILDVRLFLVPISPAIPGPPRVPTDTDISDLNWDDLLSD